LRAYDEQGLICERPYTYQASEKQQITPKKKAEPPPPRTKTRAEINAYVHPDFGVELRSVTPSEKLAQLCGSVAAARRAIMDARRNKDLVPAEFAFSMTIETPHGQTTIYITAMHYKKMRDGKSTREIWAFLDEQDREVRADEKIKYSSHEITWGAL